jgi:hypothetical protein
MRTLLTLLLLFASCCQADDYYPHPKYLLINDNAGDLAGRHFDFSLGSTTVSQYDYTVKITAEQRFSDKQLLIIAFPQEMGVSFRIHRVRIGKAPQFHLKGPVAHVTGVFSARVSENGPLGARMTVPVQIAPVNEFTVSANEALIQGNQYVVKNLPRMVTGDMP